MTLFPLFVGYKNWIVGENSRGDFDTDSAALEVVLIERTRTAPSLVLILRVRAEGVAKDGAGNFALMDVSHVDTTTAIDGRVGDSLILNRGDRMNRSAGQWRTAFAGTYASDFRSHALSLSFVAMMFATMDGGHDSRVVVFRWIELCAAMLPRHGGAGAKRRGGNLVLKIGAVFAGSRGLLMMFIQFVWSSLGIKASGPRRCLMTV
jgi:hypothetical protein